MLSKIDKHSIQLKIESESEIKWKWEWNKVKVRVKVGSWPSGRTGMQCTWWLLWAALRLNYVKEERPPRLKSSKDLSTAAQHTLGHLIEDFIMRRLQM